MKKGTLVKLLASFAVLGAAASIAGLGTFATFTSSTSANQSIQSGTVSITLGATGPANRLTVGASNLVAGDTIQRAVDLVNNGTASSDNLSSVQLTTTASPSSALDTDASNGLQMVVDSMCMRGVEGVAVSLSGNLPARVPSAGASAGMPGVQTQSACRPLPTCGLRPHSRHACGCRS